MPPSILATHPIISATITFQQRYAAILLARLAGGKTSLEDDDRPERKTAGVDFVKIAALGSVVEAQRLGFPVSFVDGVAVIRLEGPMDRYGDWYGGASTAETTVAVICAMNDPAVACTVMRVNSPGGSVDGLAELGDAVKAHAEVKPIYVQVEGGAYSAALYASAHATAIYAHRMDEVGSIGTILGTYDLSAWFKEMGVEAVVIATGDYKGAGFPGAPITDAQREEWKRGVLVYFADFKKQLQVGRELTKKQVEDLADGRYWIAGEALELGLIDKIQGTAETMAMALKKAGSKNRQASARASIDKALGTPTSQAKARIAQLLGN
jgi:signal peptide peptidase SppA